MGASDPHDDETCGRRCEGCGERMCNRYGPEPALCREHCTECRVGCPDCSQVAAEQRAEADFDYANEVPC